MRNCYPVSLSHHKVCYILGFLLFKTKTRGRLQWQCNGRVKNPRRREQSKRKKDHDSGERILTHLGPCLAESYGRWPRKPVWFLGITSSEPNKSPSGSTGSLTKVAGGQHGWRSHDKTRTLKRKLTEGRRRIMLLRRNTGQCLSMQGWDKEFQSPPGVQSIEEHVRQQEVLLQVP